MKSAECKFCDLKSSAAKRLSEEELDNMDNNCVQVRFNPGDIIFKQESFSSNIVYLREGLVKIHITGPEKEQIIKISKAPSYLGIPTTIDAEINQYSATAITTASVCYIDVETFKSFIYSNGKFAYELITELCQYELRSFRRCVNRTQKNAPGRIADALLYFSKHIFKE